MPRLLRLSTMNAADSALDRGFRVASRVVATGSFSTLMTSAPMSASSIPHVGPAMICASSMTLIAVQRPFHLPLNSGFCFARKAL
jgi:hypothetical protein